MGEAGGTSSAPGTVEPSHQPYDWFARSRWQRLLGLLILAITLAGCGAVIYALATGTTPAFHNPNFLDAILESRVVMGFVRVSIIVGAAFIAVSVVGHVSQGRWLSGVGPFQIRESVQTVTSEAQTLEARLRDADETINALEKQLRTVTTALEVSVRERDEVFKDLRGAERLLAQGAEYEAGRSG